MHFRFKDPAGKVTSLANVAALLRAIQDGHVTPNSPLAVDEDDTWRPARSVAAYREAVAALGRLPAGQLLATGDELDRIATARSAPEPDQRRRATLIGLSMLLLVVLAGLRIWHLDRGGEGQVEAQVSLSPNASLALETLSVEFGDSLAQALRKRQDARLALLLQDRFRGPSLQSSRGLRATQAVADRMATDGDRLLEWSDSLGRSFASRAVAMEASQPDLAGLRMSLEDAILDWRQDLARHEEVDRSASRAVHAIATFLLEHGQSFVLENDRPRFLSRDDARQYRELWDRLSAVATDERAWVRDVQRKYPGWMASLPTESTPRFGQPLVQRP